MIEIIVYTVKNLSFIWKKIIDERKKKYSMTTRFIHGKRQENICVSISRRQNRNNTNFRNKQKE